MLSDENPAPGVASPVRPRGEIDKEPPEPDGVIVGHGGFIGKTDLVVPLCGADLTEDGARLLRALGEAGVKTGQEGCLQPIIGLVDFGDAGKVHLGDQPVLERAALPFDPSLGLGREGRDGFDRELPKDPADVSGEADAGLTQPAPDRLAADPELFPFRQHLHEMGIIELGIPFLVKPQDTVAHLGTVGVVIPLSPSPMG